MDEWLNLLISSIRNTFEQAILFLPKLIGALVLFIVGILFAKVIEKTLYRFFKLVGVNRVAKKSGLDHALSSFEIKDDLSLLLARLLFWIILFIFLLPISNLLGWVFFTELLNKIVGYVPNILAALMIILLGSWAARILSNLLRGSAARVNSEYAEVLGTMVNFLVLFITIIIALLQLDIEVWILSYILVALFGALAFGFAIAFALGAKDILRLIIAGIYINRSLTKGSKIKLPDIEGTIVEVGTIMTIIEKKNRDQIAVPNTYFLEVTKK